MRIEADGHEAHIELENWDLEARTIEDFMSMILYRFPCLALSVPWPRDEADEIRYDLIRISAPGWLPFSGVVNWTIRNRMREELQRSVLEQVYSEDNPAWWERIVTKCDNGEES
jgi:hypothetical protein